MTPPPTDFRPAHTSSQKQAAAPEEHTGPIVFMVLLRARPDKIEAAERALEKIADPTRANPDCQEFRIFQDHADPHLFTLLEHWVSPQAVMAHGRRDYMAEYMATKDSIFEDVSGEHVQEVHPLNLASPMV